MASDRDQRGRFSKGNRGGPGNPAIRRIAALRDAQAKAITPAKLTAVLNKLYRLSLAGDVAACREYLQRATGPAVAVDVLERIERIETLLSEQGKPNA